MIDVRAIANGATSRVNPNIAATVEASTGYTTAASGKRTPSYSAPAPLTVQMQALSRKEVEHLDALNFSNATAAVYANQQLSGVDRVTQSGGDLLTISGQKWLVIAVLEGWTGAGWCKAAIARQLG